MRSKIRKAVAADTVATDTEDVILECLAGEMDGYGEGMFSLLAVNRLGAAESFVVSFVSNEDGKEHLLRQFARILPAVRSYRRFILLSDEISHKSKETTK